LVSTCFQDAARATEKNDKCKGLIGDKIKKDAKNKSSEYKLVCDAGK
jgi:hypothetical protein